MGVVGLDIMSKRGKRRKYLPLEIRMEMYDDVVELGRQGLKPSEIQKKVYEKYGKQISIRNIYNWINGKHYPLGNINKFDEKPSPELGYVIGAMLSDGCLYFDGKNYLYLLLLAVNDKEYAEEFGRCLAKVLGKKEPYKPFWNKNLKQWVVKESSIQLFEFLNRPFEELKFYIEYSKENVTSFLRALFDGDGSIYVKIKGERRKRQLYLHNTNEKLLGYVQYLLKEYFGINSTLHLATKKGSIRHFPNKITKTTKDYYYLYVHVRGLLNFYKHIGFTIKRKQQRLIKAFK